MGGGCRLTPSIATPAHDLLLHFQHSESPPYQSAQRYWPAAPRYYRAAAVAQPVPDRPFSLVAAAGRLTPRAQGRGHDTAAWLGATHPRGPCQCLGWHECGCRKPRPLAGWALKQASRGTSATAWRRTPPLAK